MFSQKKTLYQEFTIYQKYMCYQVSLYEGVTIYDWWVAFNKGCWSNWLLSKQCYFLLRWHQVFATAIISASCGMIQLLHILYSGHGQNYYYIIVDMAKTTNTTI